MYYISPIILPPPFLPMQNCRCSCHDDTPPSLIAGLVAVLVSVLLTTLAWNIVIAGAMGEWEPGVGFNRRPGTVEWSLFLLVCIPIAFLFAAGLSMCMESLREEIKRRED